MLMYPTIVNAHDFERRINLNTLKNAKEVLHNASFKRISGLR